MKIARVDIVFLWNANADNRDFASLRPDAEWGSPKGSFIEDFL